MTIRVPYRSSNPAKRLPPPVRIPYRPVAGFGDLGFSSQAQGAAGGAAAGAKIGSFGGPFLTAIGAVAGAIVGGVMSALNRTDPENKNFDDAIAIATQGGPDAVLNIGNKYLVLAGLFDLEPHQVGGNFSPYNHYGRMGEQRFVRDLMTQVYNAAQSGQIHPNDSLDTVFQTVVNPWIQSMGPWTTSMPNAPMLASLLKGMVAEYAAGLQTRWKAVGGDYPFGNLPPLTFPQATAVVTYPPAPAATAQNPTIPPGLVPLGNPPQGYTPTGGTVQIQGTNWTLPAYVTANSAQLYGWNAQTGQMYPTGQMMPSVSNVSQVPVTNLPVISTPQMAQAQASSLNNPAALLSAGYQAIGSDPTFGTIFTSPTGSKVVLFNGQLQPYTQQIPSIASTLPPPLYAAPAGGLPASIGPQAAPVAPQAAGAGMGTGLPSWVLIGAGVLAVILATARPGASPASPANKGAK